MLAMDERAGAYPPASQHRLHATPVPGMNNVRPDFTNHPGQSAGLNPRLLAKLDHFGAPSGKGLNISGSHRTQGANPMFKVFGRQARDQIRQAVLKAAHAPVVHYMQNTDGHIYLPLGMLFGNCLPSAGSRKLSSISNEY